MNLNHWTTQTGSVELEKMYVTRIAIHTLGNNVKVSQRGIDLWYMIEMESNFIHDSNIMSSTAVSGY